MKLYWCCAPGEPCTRWLQRALILPVVGYAVSCYHYHVRYAYLQQSIETRVLSWYKCMRTPGPLLVIHLHTQRLTLLRMNTWRFDQLQFVGWRGRCPVQNNRGSGYSHVIKTVLFRATEYTNKLSATGVLRRSPLQVLTGYQSSLFSSCVCRSKTYTDEHWVILVTSALKTEVACVRETSGKAHIYTVQNPTPTTTL
jgi:hypothetical protein